ICDALNICYIIRAALVQLEGGYELKLGNGNDQQFLVIQVFHLVGTIHLAYLAAQVAGRYILVITARFYNGLLAYYTFTFYFAVRSVAIYYMPVAAQQFYRHSAQVLYSNAVGEKVFRAQWVRLSRLVKCFHCNTNSFRYLLHHAFV